LNNTRINICGAEKGGCGCAGPLENLKFAQAPKTAYGESRI
jgi:hypothetical protein